MKIIFWQNTPSPHIAPLLRSIAELSGQKNVRLVITGELEEWRKIMGWSLPDFGCLEVSTKPSFTEMSRLIDASDMDTIHVFSEFIADRTLWKLLLIAIKTDAKIGILSEGRDWRGIKGLLRQWHSLAYEKRICKRADFVLAIGTLAMAWYSRCQYPKNKLFDFAYSVEHPELHRFSSSNQYGNSKLRLIFIGSLTPRKQVSLLLKSLSTLNDSLWECHIVGDGAERSKLEELAQSLGLSGSIKFLGHRSNQEVRVLLETSDILILPSHWDGWGAVINEALLAGCRVVCSDYCGAADVIKGTVWGGVFRCDSRSSLQQAIQCQLDKGKPSLEERQNIKQYAALFNGKSMANYCLQIFEYITRNQQGKRPLAPWKLG